MRIILYTLAAIIGWLVSTILCYQHGSPLIAGAGLTLMIYSIFTLGRLTINR